MAPERDRRRRLFPSRLPLPKGIDEAALVVVVVGPLGLSLDVARAPLFVVVVAPPMCPSTSPLPSALPLPRACIDQE